MQPNPGQSGPLKYRPKVAVGQMAMVDGLASPRGSEYQPVVSVQPCGLLTASVGFQAVDGAGGQRNNPTPGRLWFAID
jgi:hypothetical protein